WQIAQNYPKVLQIGLRYRYKPIYVEAIHEAKVRRSLGEIKTLTIMEHREPFLDKVKQWNKFSKYSGGTLVEKCCHYFDLFNLFAASRPVSVYASGSQAVNFKDFEYDGERSDILDNAFVIVEYENGVRANFNLCMFA
ncbi:oxidoreductase, partial [Helicobacter pylori]